MILRAVIFDENTEDRYKPKHSFIWKEGEKTGTLIQHANMWINPVYSFDMFMDVLHGLVTRRKDTVVVYVWHTGHWWDLD